MKVAATLTVLATVEFDDDGTTVVLDQAFEVAQAALPRGWDLDSFRIDEIIE